MDKITTSPGCPNATDGQHEWHWVVIPALIVNTRVRQPARKKALCWKCDAMQGPVAL